MTHNTSTSSSQLYPYYLRGHRSGFLHMWNVELSFVIFLFWSLYVEEGNLGITKLLMQIRSQV